MSKRTEALRAQVEALRSEMAELADVETPSDEQVTRSSAALTEYDKAVAALADSERIDAAVADTTRHESGFGAPAVVTRKDPFDFNVRELAIMDEDDIVARAVTAIEQTKTRGVKSEAREAAVRTVEELGGPAALHALVAGTPAYHRAFTKFMRHQGNVPFYERDEAEAMEAVRTALNITTGASGQFLLPTLFDPTFIKTGAAVKNGIRSIARVEQVTQNAWNGVSGGNVTAYWTAEAAAFTEGSPTLAHPAVTAAKLTAYIQGSFEVFEDASQIAQMPALIAEGMDFVEQTAFINGSGSGAPRGVITAISATAGSTVTITTRGSFTSASSADVYAIVNAVPTRYEETATWVANKATYNLINTMSPNGGGSLYWGNFDQAGWQKPPLLGYPTVSASDMPATYASGTAFAVLGDFSRYLIVDRIGVTVEYQQLVVNSSGIPTGQRGLVAHKRVGGDVLDVNAFRFLKA